MQLTEPSGRLTKESLGILYDIEGMLQPIFGKYADQLNGREIGWLIQEAALVLAARGF